MKVLWLCNLMPSIVAKALKKTATNKEGWILGMANQVMKNNDLQLALAFPVQEEAVHGEVDGIQYYGFPEDSNHPEQYDATLESALGFICEEFHPDVIHCFGTEYPHTLAMLRIKEWKSKVLVHIQGVIELYAKEYCTGLPEDVVEAATFRDVLKKDSIWQQKEKFVARGEHERDVFRLAEQVCGRTDFDKNYVAQVNPSCMYYPLNETLRPEFYGHRWDAEKCRKHSIFVAQGNYPIKGLHFMLEALATIRDAYPDVHLYVAGDCITAYGTLKEKIKLSAYGKYLRNLVQKHGLEENVTFLGSLGVGEILKQYLNSHVYVIPSVLENSPNSLGEAMLLGMPCVASRVGGIPSLATEGKEVLMYDLEDTKALAEHVLRLFEDEKYAGELGAAAAARANLTHDAQANYKMLCWIYETIAKQTERHVNK